MVFFLRLDEARTLGATGKILEYLTGTGHSNDSNRRRVKIGSKSDDNNEMT